MSDLVGNPEDRFSHNEALVSEVKKTIVRSSLGLHNIIARRELLPLRKIQATVPHKGEDWYKTVWYVDCGYTRSYVISSCHRKLQQTMIKKTNFLMTRLRWVLINKTV